MNLSLDAQAVLELSLSQNANSQFAGCVDASSSLLVRAGANATFFDVFDKSTTVDIFSRGFELFSVRISSNVAAYLAKMLQKCFGSTKREHARDVTTASPPSLLKRGVTCANGADVGPLQVIVNEVIRGTQYVLLRAQIIWGTNATPQAVPNTLHSHCI